MLCKLCGINFETKNSFLRHFKSIHTNDGITKYVCPHDCVRTYSSYSSFKHHIQWHEKQTTPNAVVNYVVVNYDNAGYNETDKVVEDEEEDEENEVELLQIHEK